MLKDCDSCRSAPSSVYSRAESAVLCTACDADIHSMNLIFHCHHRVPLLVYPGEDLYDDDAEGNNCDYEALFGEEVDEYLDLGEYNSGPPADQDQKQQQQHGFNLNLECVKSEGSECVVPVQQRLLRHNDEHHHQQVEFDDGFRYVASLSHKVPLAAVETNSIVPDTTTTTDISTAHIRPSKGTIELFSGPPLQMPTQFSPMDREARVLRYREKKKNRKFEKTIRYASRKAYAEARPRIKGRFAKRSEVVLEVDQMFSNYAVGDDGGYGIVPSF